MFSRTPGVLAAYGSFAFVVGFGWFVLAPLVPAIMARFHTPLGSVLLLISLYGYTMIVASLPAGLWAAKKGPKPVLWIAVILTVVGLLVRVMASSYTELLMGQIVAALAYPFLIAPIGAVLRISGVTRTKMATGLVIGSLFLGMALSSLLAPLMTMATNFRLTALLAVVAGLWLVIQVNQIPTVSGSTLGRVRMVVSAWWWIGFVVSSISVMYGSISTTALSHLHTPSAVFVGAYLSSLTFLGSAVGAAFFGWLGQFRENSIGLQRVLAVLSWLFLLACALQLTGTFPVHVRGLDLAFLGFGVVGNGWYTLALEASARQAQNAGSAGLATAGYSMASNIGVAVIPVVLGPLVLTSPAVWVIIVAVMALAAVAVPFIAKGESPGMADGREAG